MSGSHDVLDVLIVGAGPAGLAAAIAATRRGLAAIVVERGALVNSIMKFPTDMVFFTTPELLEIGGTPFVSPHEKPTRHEALRYYRRVADAFALNVAVEEQVQSVAKRSDGTFVVRSMPAPESARGTGGGAVPAVVERQARTVVMATGAYDVPNRLDVPGEDLPHVAHYYREAHPYFRRRVLIVGGKNSAAETALDLFRNGAHVTLVHRRAALGESIKYWVKPDIENRIKEGSIDAHFDMHVTDITPVDVGLDGPAGRWRLPVDAVLLLTGYRSDITVLRSAGAVINEDTLAPVCNPETFETTVPGLFLAGAVIAGRESGRIFIENGRFHGQTVIDEIAKRLGR
jgi:thioredoxin reductase (NADPH)